MTVVMPSRGQNRLSKIRGSPRRSPFSGGQHQRPARTAAAARPQQRPLLREPRRLRQTDTRPENVPEPGGPQAAAADGRRWTCTPGNAAHLGPAGRAAT